MGVKNKLKRLEEDKGVEQELCYTMLTWKNLLIWVRSLLSVFSDGHTAPLQKGRTSSSW
jgi:hypothetical protein